MEQSKTPPSTPKTRAQIAKLHSTPPLESQRPTVPTITTTITTRRQKSLTPPTTPPLPAQPSLFKRSLRKPANANTTTTTTTSTSSTSVSTPNSSSPLSTPPLQSQQSTTTTKKDIVSLSSDSSDSEYDSSSFSMSDVSDNDDDEEVVQQQQQPPPPPPTGKSKKKPATSAAVTTPTPTKQPTPPATPPVVTPPTTRRKKEQELQQQQQQQQLLLQQQQQQQQKKLPPKQQLKQQMLKQQQQLQQQQQQQQKKDEEDFSDSSSDNEVEPVSKKRKKPTPIQTPTPPLPNTRRRQSVNNNNNSTVATNNNSSKSNTTTTNKKGVVTTKTTTPPTPTNNTKKKSASTPTTTSKSSTTTTTTNSNNNARKRKITQEISSSSESEELTDSGSLSDSEDLSFSETTLSDSEEGDDDKSDSDMMKDDFSDSESSSDDVMKDSDIDVKTTTAGKKKTTTTKTAVGKKPKKKISSSSEEEEYSEDEEEYQEKEIPIIEDDEEAPVQKILTVKIFKGKFLSLPITIDSYLTQVLENDKKDSNNNNSSSSSSNTTTNNSSSTDNKDVKEEETVEEEKDKDKESSSSSTTTTTTITDNNQEIKYLVLFKNKSYRSVKWISSKEIERQKQDNPTGMNALLKKAPLPQVIRDESEANPFNYFNSEFTFIEKIVSKQEKKSKKKSTTYYLVKWKQLPYEKSTWESEQSLRKQDQPFVASYNDLQITPSGSKKHIPIPSKIPVFDKNLVPMFKDDLSLKEFQVEGFLWLSYSWYHNRSSLLADEMGLGKTIQTIAFLQYLSQSVGIKGPFMVVAPLSTLGNWQKEIAKWTDIKTLVYYGSAETREFLSKYEFQRKDKSYLFEILLTTYETLMAEHYKLVKVPWRVIVLDEGHRIKNVKSKVLTKLKSIKTEHSVILTGTPLQNDMKELWTMLNFLAPDKFDDCTGFLTEYSDLKEESQVSKLHSLLLPYLLRRMKEDVELSIPIKEETVIEVELSSLQKTYYRAIFERNREFLARGIKSKSNLPKLTNIMIQIRKVCNHPFLIPGAEETIVKQEKIKNDEQLGELLIRSSSKLVLVDKLLQRLRAEGHQVLIFSQMVESLNILEDYLQYREYPYERLDGSIKSEDRQASIDRFQDKGSNSFVFLLSTRAGGVGINLTMADTVILFDSDWNPQSDLQAQARCHRIGQTSNVKVYRLITRNTYEQYLFEVATKKLLLDHIVLSTSKKGTSELDINSAKNPFKVNDATNNNGEAVDTNSPSQISQMLKYGAAYLFSESTNEASEQDKIMINEDIDKILERSTTISFDQKNKPNNLSGFSKASFASNETDMNVDINDENFWEKVLPDYKTVKQLEEKLQSGSIFSSDENRLKFVEDIIALAQSKKDDQLDSVSIEFMGDLVKLLMRVEFNTKFSTEERDRLQAMRMMLEKPRTRKRVIPEIIFNGQDKDKKRKHSNNNLLHSETDSSSDNDSDTDFIDKHDEDGYESTDSESHVETLGDGGQSTLGNIKKKGDKKLSSKFGMLSNSSNSLSTASGSSMNNGGNQSSSLSSLANNVIQLPVWNKSAKDKLKSSIFRFGFHRWKKLRKELGTNTPIRSPQEIQSVSEAFLEVGNKNQTNIMKEYYNAYIEDTHAYNWYFMGVDIDYRPTKVDKEASLLSFSISDTSKSNINVFSTQTIKIDIKILDEADKEKEKLEKDLKSNSNGTTSTTNNTTTTTKEEEKKGTIVIDSPNSDKDMTDKEDSNTKVEINEEKKTIVEEDKKDLVEKDSNTTTTTTTSTTTPGSNDMIIDKKEEIKVDQVKNEDKMDIDEKAKSPSTTTPIHKKVIHLQNISFKNHMKTSGYHLVICTEELYILRSFPLGDLVGYNSISVEVLLPGISGHLLYQVVYVEPTKYQYSVCSQSNMTMTTAANLIWQPSDFPANQTARVQTNLSRLSQMRAIKQLVVKYGKHLTNLSIPYINRGPTPGWSPENDKNLLVGVYKHGYGKHPEIFSDPDLDLLYIIKKPIVQQPGTGEGTSKLNNSTSGTTLQPPPPPLSSPLQSPNHHNSDDLDAPDNTTSGAPPSGDGYEYKIPSSESLRRRINKVTESLLRKEMMIKVSKQQALYRKNNPVPIPDPIIQQETLDKKILSPNRIEYEISDEDDSSMGSTPFGSSQYQVMKQQLNQNQNQNQKHSLPSQQPSSLTPQQLQSSLPSQPLSSQVNQPQQSQQYPQQQPSSPYPPPLQSSLSQQQQPPPAQHRSPFSNYSQGTKLPQTSPSQQPPSPLHHHQPPQPPSHHPHPHHGHQLPSPQNDFNRQSPQSPLPQPSLTPQQPSQLANQNQLLPSIKKIDKLIINNNKPQNYPIMVHLLWNDRAYTFSIPILTTVDSIKRLLISKASLQNLVGSVGEDKDNILRLYHNDKALPPTAHLQACGVRDRDSIQVVWESKWKTIQVRGFDFESVLMNVQDDTLLEDIVKAYFMNFQPPYEIKNLRVELNGKTLDLNSDIGTNNIKGDSFLTIVPSNDIIRVRVIPSWGGEKEIYALHKKTTVLSKLIDSFLKKYTLLPKQIDFYIPRLGISLDPNKTPAQMGIENETDISAVLLLVRVDATFTTTTIPYFLSATTSFESLFQRFCDKVGIRKENAIFIYQSRKLNAEDTPDTIRMSPQAKITVLLEKQQQPTPPPQQQQQQSPTSITLQEKPSVIEIEVKLVGHDAGSFIKMNTLKPFPLRILMDKFCEEHNLIKPRTYFTFKGHTVNPEDTLSTIGLKDADIIECHTS